MDGRREVPMERREFKTSPTHSSLVEALEGQIEFLEKFITRLIAADATQRDELLRNFTSPSGRVRTQSEGSLTEPSSFNSVAIPIRTHTGHLRRRKDGNAAQFYGPTSLFQISPGEPDNDLEVVEDLPNNLSVQSEKIGINNSLVSQEFGRTSQLSLAFSPRSEICCQLMATFFQHQYQYHMCLYREWFLRDYHVGGGPYYSDLLLYAICAIGALADTDVTQRELSGMFFNRAQELLYGGALESPCLTTLQALILLGHREIGQGKTSKGWLFSGMAFRLAHEMGLHLDPSNWNGSADFRIEREILRRTYWAAFIADKQLSLYFGRPPALYPGESDVRNTERIPYPVGWEFLLNKYILEGGEETSQTAYEDGLAVVAGWIHHVEFCKILHRMITEVFENRNRKTDETVLAASVLEINIALTKWLAGLPKSLHWNEWSSGDIPAFVLHLHMQYYSAMIILHRPPKQSFRDPGIASSQSIKKCYKSLGYIIKLLGVYKLKKYKYGHLPFTFIHVLATAASVILMKRQIENLSWNNPEINKPLDEILTAFDGVSGAWPCAIQVREMIASAISAPAQSEADQSRNESPPEFDIMKFIAEGGDNQNFVASNFNFELSNEDIGSFDPEFFNDAYSWGNGLGDDFAASSNLFDFETPLV
ncbi:hypothetical protein G7Y89_g6963 [Cudoniella acicularis]|uniref:Xylanolytic transcriptional activator regulatory domain-containing protein n=1 Tax=Cudoniella acicularis TaxID=354080 RepID=A0A8H4W1Y9_9HELO|nr:hypothetical protein G7Y89_g6963 [Cudoniella acicularis]